MTTSFPTELVDLNPLQDQATATEATDTGGNTHFWNKIRLSSLELRLLPGVRMEFSPTTSVARDISATNKGSGGQVTSLQPGNSTVRTFTLKTRRGIRFKPATYRFNILIEYELENCRNLDTIEHIINIRASLTSILLGALIGGFAGWFINKKDAIIFDINSLLSNLPGFVVSILVALLAVILLARKKDIQPLITVEDIWGGLAIGFIAAYTGPKYLETMIQPAGTTNPAGTTT